MIRRSYEGFGSALNAGTEEGWTSRFLQGEYLDAHRDHLGFGRRDRPPITRMLVEGEGRRGIGSLGEFGRTGPERFGAERVFIRVDDEGIHYSIRRPESQAGSTAGDIALQLSNPDLRYAPAFRFDIAQGGRRTRAGVEIQANAPAQGGETRDIVLTNVTGMRYRNDEVVSVTIGLENRDVRLTITTRNGEGVETTHPAFTLGGAFLNEDVHHTHGGFTDLFNYGNRLRRTAATPQR